MSCAACMVIGLTNWSVPPLSNICFGKLDLFWCLYELRTVCTREYKICRDGILSPSFNFCPSILLMDREPRSNDLSDGEGVSCWKV